MLFSKNILILEWKNLLQHFLNITCGKLTISHRKKNQFKLILLVSLDFCSSHPNRILFMKMPFFKVSIYVLNCYFLFRTQRANLLQQKNKKKINSTNKQNTHKSLSNRYTLDVVGCVAQKNITDTKKKNSLLKKNKSFRF